MINHTSPGSWGKWYTHAMLVVVVAGLREADTTVPTQLDHKLHTFVLDPGHIDIYALVATNGTEAPGHLICHPNPLSHPTVVACGLDHVSLLLLLWKLLLILSL